MWQRYAHFKMWMWNESDNSLPFDTLNHEEPSSGTCYCGRITVLVCVVCGSHPEKCTCDHLSDISVDS